MKLIHVVVYKLTLYILIVKLILEPKKKHTMLTKPITTHMYNAYHISHYHVNLAIVPHILPFYYGRVLENHVYFLFFSIHLILLLFSVLKHARLHVFVL